MSESDSALLEQWRVHRRANVFREIVRRHSRMVFATCRRILTNPSDAEDVTQECFLTLSLTSLPTDVSLGGWLHTVATRRSIDRLRSDRRRHAREEQYSQTSKDDIVHKWNSISPIVDECIERLPVQIREILVAYYLDQRSQADIAKAISVSQSTVSRTLTEGIQEVRKALRQYGITVPVAMVIGGLSASANASVPHSLVATLGKIAISGGARSITPQFALGGIIVAKKYGIVVTIVCALVFGLWVLSPEFFRRVPDRPESAKPVALPSSTEDLARIDTVDRDNTTVTPNAPTDVQATSSSAPIARNTPSVTPSSAEPQETGKVNGTVVWMGSREPVPNRAVRLRSEPGNEYFTTKTNIEGLFRFGEIPPGDYDIKVTDENVFPERKPVAFTLGAGEILDGIELGVSDGGSIEGRISIGDEPVAESLIPIAQVEMGRNHGTLIASTDTEGWYRIDGILEGERQYYAMLELDGRASLMSNMPRAEVFAGDVTRIDFAFASGLGTLDGLILLNDQPASNRNIVITFYERSGNDVVGQVFLETDAEGLYAIDGVPYRGIIVGAAMMIQPGRPIYPGPGGMIQRRDGPESVIDFLFTHSDGILEGLVTIDGEPAINRRILVSGHFTNTDETGYYRIDGIQAGPFKLWAELITANGKIFTTNRPTIEVGEGEKRVANFDFPGGTGTLTGLVETEEGHPITGRVAAFFVNADADGVYFVAKINLDGRYRIQGLPATTVELSISPENGDLIPLPVAPVNIEANEIVELDIVISDHLIQ